MPARVKPVSKTSPALEQRGKLLVAVGRDQMVRGWFAYQAE